MYVLLPYPQAKYKFKIGKQFIKELSNLQLT